MEVKDHLPLEELKRLERVEKDANEISQEVDAAVKRPRGTSDAFGCGFAVS